MQLLFVPPCQGCQVPETGFGRVEVTEGPEIMMSSGQWRGAPRAELWGNSCCIQLHPSHTGAWVTWGWGPGLSKPHPSTHLAAQVVLRGALTSCLLPPAADLRETFELDSVTLPKVWQKWRLKHHLIKTPEPCVPACSLGEGHGGFHTDGTGSWWMLLKSPTLETEALFPQGCRCCPLPAPGLLTPSQSLGLRCHAEGQC